MTQKNHASLAKNGIESAKVSSAEDLKTKQKDAEHKNDVLAQMNEAKHAEAKAEQNHEAIKINRTDKEVVTNKYRQTLIRFDHLTKSNR